MAKTKSTIEFTRVNINVPNNLIERVKQYAENIGINTTSAYIVLLNNALDQKDTLTNLPEIVNLMNEIKALGLEDKDKD